MDFKSLLLNIGLCKTSDVETENKKCGPFEVKSQRDLKIQIFSLGCGKNWNTYEKCKAMKWTDIELH